MTEDEIIDPNPTGLRSVSEIFDEINSPPWETPDVLRSGRSKLRSAGFVVIDGVEYPCEYPGVGIA